MNRFYAPWVAAGSHWRLPPIITTLRDKIRAKYPHAEIGTLGNYEHLTATAPEDHTPYSVTPWPDPLPADMVTAIDIGNMPTLPDFVIHLVNSARNGTAPFVKYINYGGHHWTHLDGFTIVHPSTDDPGHCHLSIRTDYCTAPLTWNPFSYQTVTPLMRDLKLGDHDDSTHGPDVSHVQTLLNRAGVFDPPLAVDGIYGPRTEACVRSFQRVRHLTVDGIVGPKTYAALNA